MDIRDLLTKFDAFLSGRGLRFEAVAIGGAALNLIGVISRYTRDCDILDPTIPEPILSASRSFAEAMRAQGNVLRDDWLNNGPSSLTKDLPADWKSRLAPAFNGKAIILHTLGRLDLLKTKIFALCDRGTDKLDCLLLKPTRKELLDALDWVKVQDANPEWPDHVTRSCRDLANELGYEL